MGFLALLAIGFLAAVSSGGGSSAAAVGSGPFAGTPKSALAKLGKQWGIS